MRLTRLCSTCRKNCGPCFRKKSGTTSAGLSSSLSRVRWLETIIVPHSMLTIRSGVEDFKIKKIFPVRLKPMVKAAGEKAIDTNCFGEAFFRALTCVLPYNKFTMKVKKVCSQCKAHLTRSLHGSRSSS